jgi:glycosyltransferase involved in cell wall biosynthesis
MLDVGYRNFFRRGNMRIGIDVRYLSHGLVGGIHTYLKNLIPALVEAGKDHQFYLYADAKREFELDHLPANATLRLLPYKNPAYSVLNDLFIRKQMAHDHIDVAHFTANYGFGPDGVPVVITLHDEINILPWREIIRGHAKNSRTILMMTYLHVCSQRSVKGAALVFTVSEYARHQIARYSRLPLDRIVAIPHAPAPDLQRVSDSSLLAEVCSRYKIDKPFVLADALKNPAVLARAWKRLPVDLREANRIVYFSRRQAISQTIQDQVSAGEAVVLINPPRADLIALFSQAQAFIFPSWIEGFGIPVLEAMTCGAPVVASDRGAIPEVAGDAALIIDAEDDLTLATYIERLLRLPEERERYRQRDYQRAVQFSWQRSAKEVLECYQMVKEIFSNNKYVSENLVVK